MRFFYLSKAKFKAVIEVGGRRKGRRGGGVSVRDMKARIGFEWCVRTRENDGCFVRDRADETEEISLSEAYVAYT